MTVTKFSQVPTIKLPYYAVVLFVIIYEVINGYIVFGFIDSFNGFKFITFHQQSIFHGSINWSIKFFVLEINENIQCHQAAWKFSQHSIMVVNRHHIIYIYLLLFYIMLSVVVYSINIKNIKPKSLAFSRATCDYLLLFARRPGT